MSRNICDQCLLCATAASFRLEKRNSPNATMHLLYLCHFVVIHKDANILLLSSMSLSPVDLFTFSCSRKKQFALRTCFGELVVYFQSWWINWTHFHFVLLHRNHFGKIVILRDNAYPSKLIWTFRCIALIEWFIHRIISHAQTEQTHEGDVFAIFWWWHCF